MAAPTSSPARAPTRPTPSISWKTSAPATRSASPTPSTPRSPTAMAREQLIPTVADIDGDGHPDLLVADRNGEIGVYLNPGPPRPRRGTPPQQHAELRRQRQAPPASSRPYAADFNGDGPHRPHPRPCPTATSPSRSTPAPRPPPSSALSRTSRGEDRLGRNIHSAQDVSSTTFPMYGNLLAYFTVVNAQEDPESKPPEGVNCLKAGYWPQAPCRHLRSAARGHPRRVEAFHLLVPPGHGGHQPSLRRQL